MPSMLNLRPHMDKSKGDPVWYQRFGGLFYTGNQSSGGRFFTLGSSDDLEWFPLHCLTVSVCH